MHQAFRNAVEQPIRHHDDKKFIKVIRKHAEEAYANSCQGSVRRPCDSFRDGFVEGFIDYVEAGGTGEPPYLPPLRYRLTHYRTENGIAVIENWYAGFRQGALAARGSGLRELNYVPLPGPAIPADQLQMQSASPISESPAEQRSPWDQPGMLPRPTAVPPMPVPVMPAPPAIPLPGIQEPPGEAEGASKPAPKLSRIVPAKSDDPIMSPNASVFRAALGD